MILAALLRERGLHPFLFNTDLWQHYAISLTPAHFQIVDPTGRRVRSENVTAALWRKPWLGGAETVAVDQDSVAYFNAEVRYITREITQLMRATGALRLVEPEADRRVPKLAQLRVAEQFFRTPRSEVVSGVGVSLEGPVVAKSLSSELVSQVARRFMYTRQVDTARLDLTYPWFLQNMVPAEHDVTVVYVAGKIYPFINTSARSSDRLDWRVSINTTAEDTWATYTLSASDSERICQLMARLGLKFGRLDFLVCGKELIFLEVNSNGQYAWLDLEPPHEIHAVVVDAMMCEENSIGA